MTIPFPLTYHERELDPRPINAPLHELVVGFNRTGREVFVLEPGDGTRYVFILVKGVTVPDWERGAWFVVPLEGLSCNYVLSRQLGFMPERVESWDLGFLINHWSRKLFAAWVRWFYAVLQEPAEAVT